MTRGRYGISLATAALLSLLAGCAAERAVLTTDSGLTAEALRADGLAIVGVTVVEEVEQVRPPLVAALEGVLRERRPDLSFRGAEAVRDSLGLATYRRILSGYQSNGKLSALELETLATGLRGSTRFALLARVDKNVVRLPRARRAYDAQYGDRYGTSSQNFGPGAASRDTRVRVTLYDLASGREAWAAVYASSSDNFLPDSVSRLPERLVLPRAGDPSGAPLEPSPEAPSLAQAVLEGFRAFVADLPLAGNAAATPPAR